MDEFRLEERLTTIEARLSRIEKQLSIPRAPASFANTATNPSGPWEQAAPSLATSPAAYVAQRILPKKKEDKPGNWLGVISIICFVLAAGFIIKLSVDSGWLTPAKQIAIAIMLGLSLMGAGFILMNSDREYASLLPGAGIIVLYLSVFAAHSFYDLIPFEFALALTALVSGLCILLYTEIKHDVYPITAAVGSYIAPALLGLHTGATFTLYYFMLCSLAFAVISIWLKSRILTMISAYLAILMTAFVGFSIQQDMLIVWVLAAYFIIFSVSAYIYTLQHHTPLTETEAWSFLPVLLIFYAIEYYFIDRIYPGLAPWISLGFAGLLIGLYLSAKRFFPDSLGSQSLIVAFVTIVCFHSVYLELLPVHVRAWLFIPIMLGYAFLPANFSAKERGGVFYIPALALLAIVAIEYLSIISHLFGESGFAWLLVSFAAFASIWNVLITKPDRGNAYGHTLLGAAHVIAILGLYRLTHDIGSLAVSTSWLSYAVCILIFAFVRQDETMARSAMFVLGFAAAKALLYDAASAPTIVRIMCLLLTGVVLYGAGFLMRRISEWK